MRSFLERHSIAFSFVVVFSSNDNSIDITVSSVSEPSGPVGIDRVIRERAAE